MKLLIITQKIDKEDPILGFFHGWILGLSKQFEMVSVICLEKGKFDLPPNVKIFSLGKESRKSKIKYVLNFYRYILGLHADYDAVFIHMNQEYVLLGGFIWKILKKKVYFWRNHQYGSLLTRIAVWLSNKVFCTSKFAFVAKYKKTNLMPVGIDLENFNPPAGGQISNFKNEERKNRILFLGRMDSIKRPELLIEALHILNKKNVNFICDFYGDPVPENQNRQNIIFHHAIPNHETPKIYQNHEIFVNLTPSGSFDKTILEAAICGCILVIANKSLSGEIDERMIIKEETPTNIAERIDFWLNASDEEKRETSEKLQKYVLENHSLNALIEKLCIKIKK
jgi:glycosyltransferase involved in cell wall biosynthesis